jgi:hypothetical protein
MPVLLLGIFVDHFSSIPDKLGGIRGGNFQLGDSVLYAGAPTSPLTTALQATVLRAPSTVGFDSHLLRASNGGIERGGRMMMRNERIGLRRGDTCL